MSEGESGMFRGTEWRDNRLAKIARDNRPQGVRSRGRPKKQWNESVKTATSALNLEEKASAYIEEEEEEEQQQQQQQQQGEGEEGEEGGGGEEGEEEGEEEGGEEGGGEEEEEGGEG
jgi:hypothetical protein